MPRRKNPTSGFAKRQANPYKADPPKPEESPSEFPPEPRSRVGLAQPRGRKPKTDLIRFRIEPSLRARVEDQAHQFNMTLSSYCTQALELALAKWSSK